MNTGWWDAPLALQDLAEAICILTMPILLPWGLLVHQVPVLPTFVLNFAFPGSSSQQTSTQALPWITTQPQQSTDNNLLYCLHSFTLLLPLERYPVPASPQNFPSLFFEAYINTTRKNGSNNSAVVATATDTFVTSMQPYPTQPHLTRGTYLLIETVSIGLSHMEWPTGFSQASHKQIFPTFHYRTSSFCWLPICPSLEPSKPPPKEKQDFNRLWEFSHVMVRFKEKSLFCPIFLPDLNPPSNSLPQRYMQLQ